MTLEARPKRAARRAQRAWLRSLRLARTSRLRRLGVWLVMLLLLGGLAGYRYVTDSNRLRRMTQAYLQQFFTTAVTVGEVQFTLMEGIQVSDVRVADPDAPVDGQPLLGCEGVWLRHDPLALLLGRFEVDELVATRPVCRANYNAEAGEFNIQRVVRAPTAESHGGIPKLPELRIQEAHLLLYADDPGSAAAVEDIALSVTAQPGAGGRTYDVAWTARTNRTSRGRFTADLRHGVVEDREGGAPWLSLTAASMVIEATDPRARWWIDALGVTGRFRIVDYVLSRRADAAHKNHIVLEFEDARLSVPIDPVEEESSPDDRFVRLDQVTGRVVVSADGARAELAGLLGGAPCRLAGELRGDVSRRMRFADVGFDVKVELAGLELPRTDADAPAHERRFVNRWDRLRYFFRDFAPRGRVDIVAALAKRPGAGAGIELRRAQIHALGNEVHMSMFPYTISDVEGALELTPDGVFLNGLTGRHGDGEICAHGWFGGMPAINPAELFVSGRNIPLDDDLCAPIEGRHRTTWERFAPRGLADIDVRMWRPAGSGKPAPWAVEIDADLQGVDAEFEAFPYPLRDLRGNVRIRGDTFEVTGVHGACGSGRMHADGRVRTSAGGLEELDLRVRTETLPLDERLLAALPPDGRDELEALAVAGTVAAEVQLADVDGEAAYDVTVDLAGARATPRALPVPLNALAGRVRIQPDGVTLDDVSGEAQGGRWRASGRIARVPEAQTHVAVRGENVQLTEELRAALPNPIREALAPWRIDGTFDLEGDFGDEASQRQIRVGLDGATVTHRDFPIAWQVGSGEVVLAGERAWLRGVRATHAGAELTLTGEVSAASGELACAVRDLSLQDGVRESLPWRWRRRWNDLNPRGRVDLYDGVITWQRAEGVDALVWRLGGTLLLQDMELATTPPLRSVSGQVDLGGEATGSLADVFLKGDLRLKQVVAGDHAFTDITGRVLRDGAGKRLRFDQLNANLHGGVATGELNFDEVGGESHYSLEMTLQRAQVAGFVGTKAESTHGEGAGAPMSGYVDGRFFLTGVAGDVSRRRGGGRVQVREAELFRLPLLLSVLHVINLSAPEASAFQSASTRLTVVGDELRLRNIELAGGALALIGEGSMALSTGELDLRLVTVSPHRWAKLPVVSEMMEGMARELVEVQVTGTLREPRAEAQPLRNLEAMLEAILTLRNVREEDRPTIPPGQ